MQRLGEQRGRAGQRGRGRLGHRHRQVGADGDGDGPQALSVASRGVVSADCSTVAACAGPQHRDRPSQSGQGAGRRRRRWQVRKVRRSRRQLFLWHQAFLADGRRGWSPCRSGLGRRTAGAGWGLRVMVGRRRTGLLGRRFRAYRGGWLGRRRWSRHGPGRRRPSADWATMTDRRRARTQPVDAPMDMAGSCLSQLDPAPARLRADLHATEHSPGGGAAAWWPAAISPSGWLESPPACRASEPALMVRGATLDSSNLAVRKPRP
jgi:hypothetical protein